MRSIPKFQILENVKAKSLAIILGLAALYISVFFLIQYLQSSAFVKQELQSFREEVVRLFNHENQIQVSFYQTRLKCHLASPGIMKAFEERDSKTLFEASKPKFDILRTQNPSVTRMQFYAPDGTSLLRVHEEGMSGDDIASLRPMVDYAVKNQSSVSGFEEGYFGLAYRIIEPVFNEQNRYIGSVEFGLQTRHFEEVVKALFPDIRVMMVVPQNRLKMPRGKESYEAYQGYYLVGEDPDLFKPFFSNGKERKSDALVEVENRKYLLINDLYLNDYENKPFIQLLLLKDMHKMDKVFYKEVSTSALIALFLLLMTWLAADFSLRYFVKNVTRLNKELAESHAKMDAVFRSTREGIAILNLNGRFISVNPAFTKLLGYSDFELLGMSFEHFTHTRASEQTNKLLKAVVEKQFIDNVEQLVVSKSGKKTLLQISFSLLPDERRILMVTRDITHIRAQQVELERYMNALDENVITSKTDLDGNITFASQAFCDVSGYSKEELMGQKHSIIRHPDTPMHVYEKMWETITSGHVWKGELKNLRKDGSAYWVFAAIGPEFNELGEIVGYTAIRHDITDKKRVEELSVTDELTGLYNRRYYNEIFERELNRRRRDRLPFLFVLMDIDHFKRYNDTYGHQAGDEALTKVADAINQCFQRTGDYLFRLGGEEFGAILNVDSEAGVEPVLARIHQCIAALELPHAGNPPYGVVTLSVGAYLETEYLKSRNETAIYLMADKALYEAKNEGRSRSVLKVNL
ncbi:sensor domain-containing diguanylate cyclase [Thiomicrorhabdus chilensis]|uniref:sensor domain-containing diguanylate cyclase n=1 Tax=Thiomicrorhabdus chilensis TaxID=63656 RepID=UPI0004074B51|nr:diguanylate cyclase [Thiomicrorhabdus chilensis]